MKLDPGSDSVMLSRAAALHLQALCSRRAWQRSSKLSSKLSFLTALFLLLADPAGASGPYGPETCKQGYVWREACSPDDHVCVLPAVRAQAAVDNAQAAAHRANGGAFGVDTCKQGYVWREACGPQDHVCVVPATRSAAAQDDSQAAARFASKPVLWDVLTQHQDAARNGAQLNETTLKPSKVNAASFGRLLARNVKGQIISQPLYVSNQWSRTEGLRNVVYVVTRANWVYAFDADSLDPNPDAGLIWAHPVLVGAASRPNPMCGETAGPVGITSTPVIDRASDTLYLVARHADGSIWIHALDTATGLAKAGTPGSVRISAPGFDEKLELNRAGLLMQKGAIFVAFSALDCDNTGWQGWVFAYRAPDLARMSVFTTASQASPGAGIWASGNGLVGDGSDIYFETGNRQGNTPQGSTLDESFVKLKVGPPPGYHLSLAAHYTVSNREPLNGGDTDLGAGGPLLLPGKRLVGGGKQGKLYILDTASLAPTQFASSGPLVPGGSDGFQAYINTWHDDSHQPECTDVSLLQRECFMPHARYEDAETFGPNIHTGPIFWESANPAYGLLYAMPEKDYLRSYRFDKASHTLATSVHAISSLRSPDGMPGSFLSLSADADRDGIVWASVPKMDGQWQNVPGRLVAFDALTLKELWRDDDDIAFPKFTPPTVAGGKVFRPTFANQLLVYGLKQGPTPLPCYTIAQKYNNYAGADGLLGASTSAETPTPDGIGHYQHFTGASIYYTPATCAWEVHGAIRNLWSALGWERGFLGYPVTDENVTPDGLGRYNHFQNGSIYWSVNTGAHEVHGLIRDRWSALGWERSTLGYPISDETDEVDGSGRFSTFEHGTIHWNRASNAVTVNVDAGVLITPFVAGMNRAGSDISHLNLPAANPAMCQQQCADNAACVSWTMVNPGVQGPSAVCWLKNATPVENADANCTSGLKVDLHPAGMSAMAGRIDRPGGDFASFDLPSPDPRLCQGECAHNGSCKAWTYKEATNNTNPHCWLKSSIPATAGNGLTISGFK